MVRRQGIRLPLQETWVGALTGRIPRAAEQPGPRATTTEPVLCSLGAASPRSTDQKSPQGGAPTPRLEKSLCSSEDPAQPKVEKYNYTYTHKWKKAKVRKQNSLLSIRFFWLPLTVTRKASKRGNNKQGSIYAERVFVLRSGKWQGELACPLEVNLQVLVTTTPNAARSTSRNICPPCCAEGSTGRHEGPGLW